MALIKEPLEIDFFVEPKPLSDTERIAISDFIKSYKKQNSKKKIITISRRSCLISARLKP
jgi:hypothetical protein